MLCALSICVQLCCLLLLLGSTHTQGQQKTGYLAEIAKENPALPDDCLLASERYNLTIIHETLSRHPQPGPNSNHVVILKLHLVPGGLRADQALAFKALAAEVLEAGYDFYILHDKVSDIPMTAKQTIELLPRELHPYIILHDFKSPLAAYPLLVHHLATKDEATFGPGPVMAYLPLMDFMLQYVHYEWAWELEFDNRYIGHWGRFLNTVLHLAHGAEARSGGWDEWGGLTKHHHRQPHMHTLPKDSSRAPDLVFFGPAYFGEKWHETQIGTNKSSVWHASIMIWGGSKRLFQAMQQLSIKGQGGYVETFLMQTAAQAGLKVVPVALPYTGESYHCCMADGEDIYQRFLESTEVCTHSILLHPVKLCGDDWPREQGVTQHSIPTRPRYGPKDRLC